MWGTSFLVFERTTGRFLEFFCGTQSTRPIAGDIAVFLPLIQADIDRKAAAGADVSQMKPHFANPALSRCGWRRASVAIRGTFPTCNPALWSFTDLPPQESINRRDLQVLTHPGASEVETVKRRRFVLAESSLPVVVEPAKACR